MNIKELIIDGTNKLKENNIQDSNIKARILLQYILKQDKNYFVINSEKQVDEHHEKRYNQYIQDMIQGKPLQYITNIQEFMGLDFYVDENVLIPQPDTEVLVEETIKEIEEIIEYIRKNRNIENLEDVKNEKCIVQDEKVRLQYGNNTIRVLDMCTGSGAIAISIAKYFQKKYEDINEINLQKENKTIIKRENQDIEIQVYGLDISEEALKIAEKNAKTNGVNITFFKSNMFEVIEENIKQKIDVIVSNPPYIETDVINTLSEEVKQEPHIALDGGQDGLDFYRIIAQEANKYLKEKGEILLEIGYNQKESVTKLFEEVQKYTDIECIQDFTGYDRVVKVKRRDNKK